MDRQCPSCGGFCKQSGCERENVATNDTLTKRVDETGEDRHEPVQTTPNFAQLKQILDNLDRCHHRDSKQEFLRTWIRDWTEHKLTKHTTPPQSFTYEQVKAHIQVALLSSQPQRTWVGLHTTTILDIYTETLKTHRGGPMPDGQIAFAKAIEQALKERNTCI